MKRSSRAREAATRLYGLLALAFLSPAACGGVESGAFDDVDDVRFSPLVEDFETVVSPAASEPTMSGGACVSPSTNYSAGGPVPVTNRMPNPSFETDASGWAIVNSSLVVEGRPSTGSVANVHGCDVLKVTRTSGTFHGVIEANNGQAVTAGNADASRRAYPGSTWVANAWVRAANAAAASSTKPIYIKVRQRDAAGTIVKEWASDGLTLQQDRFQNLSVIVTPVVDASNNESEAFGLEVRVTQSGVSSTEAFWVDAVSVARMMPDRFPYDPREGTVNGVEDAQSALISRPIPANAPLDPNSASIGATVDFINRHKRPTVQGGSAAPALWTAATTGSTLDPWWNGYIDGVSMRFRMPEDIQNGVDDQSSSEATCQADPCPDKPIIVYNANHPDYGGTDAFVGLKLWRGSFNRTNHTFFSGSSGKNGAALFRYNDDGAVFPDADGPPLSDSRPFDGHGRGSGLMFDAGLIRRADWDMGEIRHVVGINMPSCKMHQTAFRAPATKTDAATYGSGSNTGCTPADSTAPYHYKALAASNAFLQMGMRLRLKSSVDCDLLKVPASNGGSVTLTADQHRKAERLLRMVCRAMKTYGVMPLDTVPDGVTMMFAMEAEATAGWVSEVGLRDYYGFSYIFRNHESGEDYQEIYYSSPGDANSSNGPDNFDAQRTDGLFGIPWDQFEVVVVNQ